MRVGLVDYFAASIWSGAFNNPGHGAVPPVVLLTSRAVHTHLDFGKCIKHHCPGVEAGRNRLPRGRAADEDVAFDVVLGQRQDRVERIGHVAPSGRG